MESPHLWLIVSAVCLALEAFGASGIGFLFAGIGALVTAVAAHLGMVGLDNVVGQVAWFCAATAVAAALLWVPMRRWRSKNSGPGYSNMVGERASVAEGGLRKDAVGEVVWSGTRMKAQLAATAALAELPGGSDVRIAAVRGNLLLVEPL